MAIDAKSEANMSDHASVTVRRAGKLVGFSESEGRGRSAHGDVGENGNLSFGILGNTSQGEDGTLETCKHLVAVLNQRGGSWSTPELVQTPHVDAQCFDETAILQIQVVRAVVDQTLWHSLRLQGEITRAEVTAGELASLLKFAIELKAGKIAQDARRNILLALNALDTPAVCFDAVLAEFHNSHAAWCAGLGFREIWLVGPHQDMVAPLAGTPA